MLKFNMQLFHKPNAYMRAYRAKKKAEGGEKKHFFHLCFRW